jgi:Arc/MetJ-type ribon-helix-helix transcriptional regulator
MTIELTPEHQRIIESAIHSGAYHDAGEVISAALETFKEKTLPFAQEAERKKREAAIERLRTFGKTHGLTLGGITLRQLRDEARP